MRLIDADALKENVMLHTWTVSPEEHLVMLLYGIDDAPTIDAVPVAHGRWNRRGRNLGECSECGEVVAARHRYRPNCGAKMDAKEDANDG